MVDHNAPRYLVSILTPSWNRAALLQQVWRGIADQTYPNLEWVVGDDGSTDGTQQVLTKLAADSWFPIVVVSASTRIGKARLDNRLMDVARGDFLIWNDADDCLVPGALAKLVAAWDAIAPENRHRYCAIYARCQDQHGRRITQVDEEVVLPADIEWDYLQTRTRRDGVILIPRALVAARRFPEVDFVVNESSLWRPLFRGKRAVFLPDALKVVGYSGSDSISYGSKLRYCRGWAHAVAMAETAPQFFSNTRLRQLLKVINYWRYCVHGDIPLREARNMWWLTQRHPVLLTLLLPALLLVCKDLLQRKVEKTHVAFDKAKSEAVISVQRHHGAYMRRNAMPGGHG